MNMSSAELIVKMSNVITLTCKEDNLTIDFCDFTAMKDFNQTAKYLKLYQSITTTNLTSAEASQKQIIEKFMKSVTSSYKVYLQE